MLAIQRHREILRCIEVEGSVRVAALARHLHVTEETIRRDLERLEREGKVRRTHGGALAFETDRRTLPFDRRETLRIAEKRAIALAAAAHVAPGDVIALDSSTTARELARVLPNVSLTVVTNGLMVIAALLERPRIRVVATGGNFDPISLAFTGPMAEQTFERFHIRTLFLSCTGLDLERGLSVATEEDAGIRRRLIELAETTCLLVDSSKFGVKAVEFFAPIADVDVLITDAGADPALIEKLRLLGTQVETAGVMAGSGTTR